MNTIITLEVVSQYYSENESAIENIVEITYSQRANDFRAGDADAIKQKLRLAALTMIQNDLTHGRIKETEELRKTLTGYLKKSIIGIRSKATKEQNHISLDDLKEDEEESPLTPKVEHPYLGKPHLVELLEDVMQEATVEQQCLYKLLLEHGDNCREIARVTRPDLEVGTKAFNSYERKLQRRVKTLKSWIKASIEEKIKKS